MSNINPFLFLQPYGLSDHYTLMGRDEEAQALLASLKWKDIIVVFGKSGVGKTSFINHTLSAKINRVNWLPIRITRLLNINHALKQGIQCALEEELLDKIHNKDLNIDTFTIKEETYNESDPLQLLNELYIKWNRPVYLIIDQLEELFLVGDKQEQTEFLETLQLLMDAPKVPKKIILVLREEHLGYIQEVERILNGVFQDAMAVKEIKKEDGAAIFDSLLTSANPETERQLKDFAQKIGAETIKSRIIESCSIGDTFDAQKMQILLFLLWEKIYAEDNLNDSNSTDHEVNRLCNLPDPLKDYLDRTVNINLARGARLLKAPYWFILGNAISEANTKRPVSLREFDRLIWQRLGYTKKEDDLSKWHRDLQVNIKEIRTWCDDLVEKRILQSFTITIPDGGIECYYQLRHDTLVRPIKKLNTGLPLRFPKKVSLHKLMQNPYMGLRQYEYGSSSRNSVSISGIGRKSSTLLPVLYGRESVINEYLEFLKNPENKYLVVVGDSGTGKSSLVKGGLLPAMQQAGFSTSTIQPGPDLETFTKELQVLINKNENGFEGNGKYCLYIDQFEESYTFREPTPEEKNKFDRFMHFLTREIDNRSGNFKLIVSIRHDYAHEFDRNISQWRSFKKLLRYPNQDEIFDIIVGPAYDRGVRFQPADLPETIAADAINTSYFLPLLSFTMETLYKKDVLDHLDKQADYRQLTLTDKGYRKVGEIVKCLQNEFTCVYKQLSDSDKRLFLEIIARMIIIKDTIPKARPLAIARINYIEPGKADRIHQIILKFTPRFFREKEITVGTCTTRCYEPIHDSLLVYCDEIRQIVNKVQEPGSQMYLQPKIEAAVKEWKVWQSDGYESKEDLKQEAGDNKLLAVIHKRYKELEPLFDFVLNNNTPAVDNWLFKEEWELVREGKEYANELKNREEMAMSQKLRQLEWEKQQQLLLQEKLNAERDRALVEVQKKEQELQIQTYKAKLVSERRLKWIIYLASLLLLLALGSYSWYKQNQTNAIIKEKVFQQILLKNSQKTNFNNSPEK